MSGSSCLSQGTYRDPPHLKTFCLPCQAQPPCAVRKEPQSHSCHELQAILQSHIGCGIPGKLVKRDKHLHQFHPVFHRNYPRLSYLGSCFIPQQLFAYLEMMLDHTMHYVRS